jgi:ketosteroid isomerase-like protein
MNDELELLLSQWATTERSGDAAGLEELLADDFVGIGPVGFVLDKAAWLARFDGGLHYDDLSLDEVSIHRHGDTAIAVAHQHAVGTARGNPTPPDTRVAFTIVCDGGALRIAGMQYSFLGIPQ